MSCRRQDVHNEIGWTSGTKLVPLIRWARQKARFSRNKGYPEITRRTRVKSVLLKRRTGGELLARNRKERSRPAGPEGEFSVDAASS